MKDITPIVELVVQLILLLVSAFVIPWLKTKLDNEKYDKLKNIVRTAVLAAEQMFTDAESGKLKYNFVSTYLAEHGYNLDEGQLRVHIESVVNELFNKQEAA